MAPDFTFFSELPPGSYSLDVTANGFKESKVADIAVAAETPRNLNVNMQTDGAAERDASIGSTITSDEIQRLPTVGADPYELLRTAPRITVELFSPIAERPKKKIEFDEPGIKSINPSMRVPMGAGEGFSYVSWIQ
jgi:hypothetical protein